MTHRHSDSPAFRQARLQSERLRIFILLTSLAFIIAFRGIRTYLAPTQENVSTFLLFLLILSFFFAFELLALRSVQRAIRSHHFRASRFWLGNLLIEICLPAFLIASITGSATHPDYRALANPTFLLYFLLLILSTLRLNPLVSALCGLLAASTYLLAAYHIGWNPASTVNSLYSPQKLVVTYAVSLIVGGFASAVVAREFRRQVDAALREADTRRQVEHLQHDLDVARSIQQSLLPHSMPQLAGWDIAAWNQPADQTGGDYYDWQPLPNNKIVVALADVTGHGIGPALLAAVCRAYARSNFRSQDTFAKAMSELNSAVAADVQEGRFITFVAAILGPDNSTVELLSAGHAPLFLYWLSHDKFELMEAHGLPLGVSEPFLADPPRVLEFAPGDLLILATDGFFEWANTRAERFGSDRLEQSIRNARNLPAAEIISSLYGDVLRFSAGTKQMDDLTAIVLKRL